MDFADTLRVAFAVIFLMTLTWSIVEIIANVFFGVDLIL